MYICNNNLKLIIKKKRIMEKKKIIHLQLKDGFENKKTLVAHLVDGSISYSLYGGWSSSGIAFSLSNISFYEYVNGKKYWNDNICLPVYVEEGETLGDFQDRIIEILHNSTVNVCKFIPVEVKFA